MGTGQPAKKVVLESFHVPQKLKDNGAGNRPKASQVGEAPSMAFTPSDPALSWGAHLAPENPAVSRVRGRRTHLSGLVQKQVLRGAVTPRRNLCTPSTQAAPPPARRSEGGAGRGAGPWRLCPPLLPSSAPPCAALARRPAPSPGPARYSNPECVFLQMIKSIQS